MWYNSVEFYVVAGALAAAAVVASSLPRRRDNAVLHMIAGEICRDQSAFDVPPEPAIDIEVDESRIVHIRRSGLRGITTGGAVSLAINVMGGDITIEERLTPGNGSDYVDTAMFELDFLAPERYHIRYNSEDAGVFTAFTLNVAPGIRIHRDLK